MSKYKKMSDIPNKINNLKCDRCNEKVNGYILSHDPKISYNCYKCKSFITLDGSYGTVSFIPNVINETIKSLDEYFKTKVK